MDIPSLVSVDQTKGSKTQMSVIGSFKKSPFGRLGIRINSARLRWLYGTRGLPCHLNGQCLNVLPDFRGLFSDGLDREAIDYLRAQVKPGDTCVNIGANVGYYTLQLANLVGAGGMVHAFEPNPNSCEILRRHIELNGFEERVLLHEKAVSESVGRQKFFFEGTSPLSSLGRPNSRIDGSCLQKDVELETIDHFFSQESVLRPDWFVIDVEGAEISVIRGGIETLQACDHDFGIVMELHPNVWSDFGESQDSFRSVVAAAGLEVLSFTGQEAKVGLYGHVLLKKRA